MTGRPRSNSMSAQLSHRIQLQNRQQQSQPKAEPVTLRNLKPPKLLQSENYGMFFEVIGTLIEKLEQNRALKNRIMRDCETVSQHLTQESSAKSVFRYQRELALLEEKRNNSKEGKFKAVKALFNKKATPSAKVLALRQEREDLLVLLQERIEYNRLLVRVLEEYETSIVEILAQLHAYISSHNNESIELLREMCDQWDQKRQELFRAYTDLVGATAEVPKLFEPVGNMMREMDEDEQIRDVELRISELNHMKELNNCL